MSTTVTHGIMFIYLSFILYDYSASLDWNNVGTYVNESSVSATLTLNDFLISNRTGFNVTKPKTKENKDFKANRKSRTNTKNKGLATPYTTSQRKVVNDTDDTHLSLNWATDDTGHREQRTNVVNQSNYIVTTASQVKIRPESISTTAAVPFTDDFTISTKQDRKNKQEQSWFQWKITETNQSHPEEKTEIQNQDTTEKQGQDIAETQAEDTTGPDTAEIQGQDTTESLAEDTIEAHVKDTTEQHGHDTTEMTVKDTIEMQGQNITETTGQDTTEIHGHDKTETFRTDKTHVQWITRRQRNETAVATTMFITQTITESPDQIQNENSANPETETPYIKVTLGETQRSPSLSGLIWWVSVVSGAGLGMIILLSILTVLWYRPWHRNKLIQLRHPRKKVKENMYGKMGSNRNSKRLRGVHSKNSCYGKISEKNWGDDERYQRTESVFSWGTEFDSFDPLEDVECQPMGEDINNSFMLTQGNLEVFNNSSTSSAELLGDTSLCDG